MGTENANRIQTSLLNGIEKKALVWMAQRLPGWVTSDMLTFFGVFAAVFYAFFCWMANFDLNYYWASSLCLVANWFGDSLDGTLARVRNTQRPKYGFFIDHSLDALTTCLFCIGLGLGPLMNLDIALFVMGGYLCMSIYTYLSTIVMGQFRLTYAGLGPTEVRIIIIAVCTLYIYERFPQANVMIAGREWTVFDFIGAAVAVILFGIYIISMIKDLKYLAKIDPLKKINEQRNSTNQREDIAQQ